MRETYQPPTTYAIPTQNHVIPAKAGIHSAASTLPKRQPPPATDRNRHNATESDEPQRKLVRARTRATAPTTHVIPTQNHAIPTTTYVIPTQNHAIPTHNHVIPAKAGILPLDMYCSQLAADSTYRLELSSHKPHANKSNRTEIRLPHM